jgi:hypothetical protein
VDATMTPVGFRYGTTQVLPSETCGTVTLGVLASGTSVLPNVPGVNYHVYVKASNNNAILRDFGMTHITGTSWSLDTYDPNMAILPVSTIQTGTITTAPSGTGGSCTITNGSPYLLNCAVPQGPQGPQGIPGPAGSGAPGATDMTTLTGPDFGTRLSACLAGLNTTYGGICEGRGLGYASLSMAASVTISVSNTVINLPCATITTAQQIIIAAGVRNVTIHGCAFQGGSTANGIQGGTVWVYTGGQAAFQVGDPTYAQDTKGFHIDNVNINTASAANVAHPFAFYRTQEIDVRNLYLNGNQGTVQTGIYLDGTGNYSGGTFDSVTLNGFGIGVYMTGHMTGSAVGDFANASTFTRLHIVCPTSGGNPIAGTYGLLVTAGDGNTWNGGDVEGCTTMFYLGPNAVNNTILGLRNENSTIQYQADSGSSYNSVITGGTFFTGDIVDNGSRNSFWDAFHFAHNGMKGDWYASQQDATVINHFRLGIGAGHVRGIQWESQVDNGTSASQYNWLWGLTDGNGGQSNWMFQDLLNNTIRLQMQQNNTAGGNNQTALNAAGTGNVCFNCSAYSGTGGVAFSSGGSGPSTVATVDSSGDANFLGTLQIGGVSTFQGSTTVKNQTDAEIDATLYAGLTTSQKESFIYKDYNGASQWYMVKDQNNNWALNSAPGGLDSFKAYQSTNSGDTYINTSNTSGTVRVNYEVGSGSKFSIYGGGSSVPLVAAFSSAAIQFPGVGSGLSATYYCLQADMTGFITNTGGHCLSASVTPAGAGQIAIYTGPYTLGYVNTSGTQGSNILLSQNPIVTGAISMIDPLDESQFIRFQAGATANQDSSLRFNGYSGTELWRLGQRTTGAFTLLDSVRSENLISFNTGGNTYLQSSLSNASNTLALSGGNVMLFAGTASGQMMKVDTTGTAFLNGGSPGTQVAKIDTSGNYSGNAATATALAAAPSTCSAGYAPTGITASGAATGCAPLGTLEFSTGSTYLSTSATNFVGMGYVGSGSTSVPVMIPRAGVVQACVLHINTGAETGSAYYVASLWKNGAACTSGPTVTFNSATQTLTDSTHTCSVSAGDNLSWQFVPTGTPTAAIVSVSCVY